MSEYIDHVMVNNRNITPGTEVSIHKRRGRFRFVNANVTNEGKLVLNFVGGKSGHELMRSFYPEMVKRVHRLNVTRANRMDDDQNE